MQAWYNQNSLPDMTLRNSIILWTPKGNYTWSVRGDTAAIEEQLICSYCLKSYYCFDLDLKTNKTPHHASCFCTFPCSSLSILHKKVLETYVYFVKYQSTPLSPITFFFTPHKKRKLFIWIYLSITWLYFSFLQSHLIKDQYKNTSSSQLLLEIPLTGYGFRSNNDHGLCTSMAVLYWKAGYSFIPFQITFQQNMRVLAKIDYKSCNIVRINTLKYKPSLCSVQRQRKSAIIQQSITGERSHPHIKM